MKLNFQIYIKKLNNIKKNLVKKQLKEGSFIFRVVYFQNMDFTIVNSK